MCSEVNPVVSVRKMRKLGDLLDLGLELSVPVLLLTTLSKKAASETK
jgi:hypothetical protein